jgi:hypothetical protein
MESVEVYKKALEMALYSTLKVNYGCQPSPQVLNNAVESFVKKAKIELEKVINK